MLKHINFSFKFEVAANVSAKVNNSLATCGCKAAISAYNSRISGVPHVVTHRPPLCEHTDLYSALVLRRASNQPDLPVEVALPT